MMIFTFITDSFRGFPDKTDIISYVSQNKEMLMDCINNQDYTKLNESKTIEDITDYDDTEEDGKLVGFECGYSGFASESSYWGFFYSEKDAPDALCSTPIEESELSPDDDGYLWEDSYGDNTYYVEKICDHFYYYEESY
ncbi:MAG: hypothetical protein K6G65_07305 [Lachnospiraceae bacterium]|nr:hypothetical protein [Lachnospiraceae bacterium]